MDLAGIAKIQELMEAEFKELQNVEIAEIDALKKAEGHARKWNVYAEGVVRESQKWLGSNGSLAVSGNLKHIISQCAFLENPEVLVGAFIY